jgi:hypothetical protein
MRVKNDHEVQTLIDNMAQNEYRAGAEKKKMGVFGVSENSAILENQTAMNKQIKALTKHVQAITMGQLQVQHAQVQQVAAPKCDFCGEGHEMVNVCLKG